MLAKLPDPLLRLIAGPHFDPLPHQFWSLGSIGDVYTGTLHENGTFLGPEDSFSHQDSEP